MYSSINKLYAQNPVFKIVRGESVKVYLRMYNGNVQQNLQRVESCVTNPVFEIVQESVKVCTKGMSSRIIFAQHPITKNLHISPRFSPTIFYHDANSVLLLNSTPRLYAQNPVFEVVREKGVKVWWCVHSMQYMRLTTVTSVYSVQHSITACTLFTIDYV